MDLNWRILALALAAGGLGWVLGDRNRAVRTLSHPEPTRYHASLYSLHVRAVDSMTNEAVSFKVSWEKEDVSPFAKGSGPGKIEEFPDGSKSIHLVGLPLANGLTFEISAEGYDSQSVTVRGHSGGIGTDQPDDVKTVMLVKKQSDGATGSGQD